MFCRSLVACITPTRWMVVTLVLAWCVSYSAMRAHAEQPAEQTAFRIGLAKQDITPSEPVRLSGYAARDGLHAGVADALSVRAMVLSPKDSQRDQDSLVLVSLDAIAVTSSMTDSVGKWLQAEYQIPRSQLVLASTHSHAAPHLSGGLSNLFPRPTTVDDAAATQRYTDMVLERTREVIQAAMQQRQPANLHIGDSSVGFPTNRRLLNFQTAGGAGTPPVGPLDQRVRVMKITSTTGELLGSTFMVACHCTTLGSAFTQVSGDWAGLAAARLEQLHPGAIVLPVIGCGADANPNPRGTYELAGQHAAEVVDAVEQVVARETLGQLSEFPVAQFGYAGLIPENPSQQEVEKKLTSDSYHERFWAEHMQNVFHDMGRLPESYPMPIHTWQFGQQLTWVFLGGEVVADYQLSLEQRLPTEQTWVAAYCDDVFAYVASERLRPEGGYEVDQSMLYYLQPGRWESGTQTLIEKRVDEIRQQQRSDDKPLDAQQALAAVRVPEGFRVELMASEPLVADPINIAFGIDGTVWVVEMTDYPLGTPGGGRIKWLKDSDGDGSFDSSGVFLNGLSYPSSVFPWRNGVLVIAAPDVIYAVDLNGDGVADRRETLLTGIGEANPQHRASGFEIGLDGWLHLTAGADTKRLHSLRNNQVYEIHGNDLAWNPDTGEIRFTAGETQFMRARDEFDNWFGNSNSYPMYHYVIDPRYLLGGSVEGGIEQHLLEPAAAPPVLPRSRTVDRFNDQYARDRFTSACSSIIGRVPGLQSPAANELVGLICEPVHNLVARIQLDDSGSAFRASRHPDDQQYEFFTSTDIWSRPVRAINAPDGSIWIVDMVRRVIEHPEWIPTAWQARLDLRSGEQLGRIYRVYREDYQPRTWGNTEVNDYLLLEMLSSDIGPLRDLAVQHIVCGQFQQLIQSVRQLAFKHKNPAVRAAALGCMAGKGWLEQLDAAAALRDQDVRVVRYTLQLAEQFGEPEPQLREAILGVVDRNLGPQVDLQWVLTSTRLAGLDASKSLSEIAKRSAGDPWIERALSLVIGESESAAAFSSLVGTLDSEPWGAGVSLRWAPVERLWGRLSNDARQAAWDARSQMMLQRETVQPGDVALLRLAVRSGLLEKDEHREQLIQRIGERRTTSDVAVFERCGLTTLLGSGLTPLGDDVEAFRQLLLDDESEVRQGALRQAGSLQQDAAVAVTILDNWDELSFREQSLAGAALLQHFSWTAMLLDRLESGGLSPKQIDPSTVQRLRSNAVGQPLRERAEKVFGGPSERAPLVVEYRQQLADWRAAANETGNSDERQPQIAIGAELFREHCALCHQPQEGRPALGPAVENLKHWSDEQWLTAILDPNQSVEQKFQQLMVVTDAGSVEVGILIQQNASTIRLARADGQLVDLATAEIADWKQQTVSLMPEGFETRLTAQQLGQIIDYLKAK